MNTLLNQSLMLTLIGMGMTFAAIGALVAGMYVMTAVFKDKTDAKDELPEAAPVVEFEPLWREPVEDQRPLAAAAAVSVALAEQVSSARHLAAAAAVSAALATAPATVQPVPSGASGAWDAYVRSRTLALRNTYDVRRR